MLKQDIVHQIQRVIGQCSCDHFPFFGVLVLVHVYHRLATRSREKGEPDRVPQRLLDIGLDAVDSLQGGVAVDRQPVRAIANEFAVLGVDSVEFYVAIASEAVIDVIPIRNLRDERTWVLGERMKCQPVDNDADDLILSARNRVLEATDPVLT